jgi:UDP-GlcNAc:undecaprenyl-phosphate/decaprenyl-phosphate GlcNAc-1-phosphate transferase
MKDSAVNLLLISVSALILSYLIVAAIRLWMLDHNYLDYPNNRSMHLIPTPRGGGLAIVIVTYILVGILWYLERPLPVKGVACILVGGLLVAGISYWDDLHSLPFWIRFSVHLVVAGMIVFGYGSLQIFKLPFLELRNFGWVGIPMTFIWIVGLINAYNFMDGIDGLAGGQGVVTGLGWAILGWLSGQFLIAGTGLIIGLSCLGFLGHNWPPARIFMGDVGSAFLGYTFAVMTVVAGMHDPRLIFAGAILVWPFIFDTVLTFLRRLIHGENVFTPHCSHFYQRWVAAGFSQKKIALIYIGMSTIGLIGAIGLITAWRWADYLAVIMVIIISLIIWLGTNMKERLTSKGIVTEQPQQ